MIGIIITGHGNFASGLTSSLTLIAGAPENYEVVDFVQEDGVQQLEEKILKAIESLKNCSEILVFSDLVGGSPFKTAVECSMKVSEKVTVLSGTNLGMLIECSMARNFVEDAQGLVEQVLATGKEQVMKYQYVEKKQVQESEDGI